ncbi:hypothetical protein F4859DRAFT_311302 [Xylaria cf. heliscus]|nr:hypothetical protein F4859DRAFT_311302 [Xylaria cf. heliscus]
MGQSQSQPQEKDEGYDPKEETPEKDLFEHPENDQNHHPTIDDFVFSSQIDSTNPAIPPRHSAKIKYSSSPASRLQSSQAPTPVRHRKMSASSPYQSSPVFGSAMDLGVQADEHGNPTHVSKKKKRNKKRQGSTSNPDEGQQPLPHSSTDPNPPTYPSEQQQDEVISQHKRDKKESKRAAKLAKQQAEASVTLEIAEEPSHFAEIWDSQERIVAAKREREEQEDFGVYVEESVQSQNAISKKRKRKSQAQTEDPPQQGSKKHKSLHNGTSDIIVEHDEQIHDDVVQGAETSNDDDINLNDLAEQLYSGRKRKPYTDVVDEETTPTIETGLEHEEPVGAMAVDRVEAVLTQDGSQVNDEVEMYQDDGTHYAYNHDHSAGKMASEAPSTSHIFTTQQLDVSTGDSDEPTYGANNDELAIAKVVQSDVTDHIEEIRTNINGEIALNHVDGTAYQDVEVPSSVPDPGSAGGPSAKSYANNKTKTGRKRVAKPDYFSRMVDDEIDDHTSSQSPSTAALSRRNGKGKQIVVPEYETQAGPSTANGQIRQPKITSMLRESPNGDSDVAATPTSESVVRLRTPRTPATLSGAFSDFEIRNLTQAIERFRDDHNMTQHAVNDLIHRNPKEARGTELWERIMATCPGRSRQKVINQTRRRFHNFVARGTWTIEQDQELRQLYEHHGSKYAMIGQLINRHPEDVRDRIRNYIICGDNLKKDQWSQEETDKLIAIVEQAIAEIRRQRNLQGLDDSRPVEEDISWQLVSLGMDRTRSRLQCIAKWKSLKPQLSGGGLDGEVVPIDVIIQQARETATTMSYRNRSLIISEILKTNANADSRIPWLKIRTELKGKWTRPPIMVVWFRLKRTLPGWQSLNVKEICTLLLQRFQQTHKLEYPTDESGDLDYRAEYREIEYKIKKGRKTNSAPKSAAFVSKASDDEDVEEEEEEEEEELEEEEAEEAIRDQLDATGEGAEASLRRRPRSVDLGVGRASEKERVVEDSEPETKTRSHRRRRTRPRGARFKPEYVQENDDDNQSSDTNASQVSSIPAR